jgi:hypothetical protein
MLVVNVKFELNSVLYTVCMYVCIFGDDRQISWRNACCAPTQCIDREERKSIDQ